MGAKSTSGMLKLYEIVDDYRTALEWMDEHEDAIAAAGGEIPPELDELLSQAEGEFEEKVKRVALVVQNLRANAKAAKDEADRLAAASHAFQRQAETLTGYLHIQMDRAGVPRVETPVVKVRIQRASRPSIHPVGEIPEGFQRVRVEFDGQKAYEHVKPLLGKNAPDTGEIDGLRWEYTYAPRIW